MIDPDHAIKLVVTTLETLAIPYFIGGSIASITYGEARTTLDVDLVAALKLEHIAPLTEVLQPAFYIDPQMIREAIQHQDSFNLIHLETMFKVDIFIADSRDFTRSQFTRRQRHSLDETGQFSAYLASPEDVILAKLEWYQAGNQVSDRQWQDVLGIIRIQGERLDQGYLRLWGQKLGLSDLLERALEEGN